MKWKKFILIGIFAIFCLIMLNFSKIKFALSLINASRKLNRVESKLDESNSKNIVLDNPFHAILESATINNHSNSDNKDNSSSSDISNIDNSGVSNNVTKNIGTVSDTPHIKLENILEESNPKRPYLEIIYEYNEIFENLKSEFETELDTLIKQAIEEHSSKKISKTKLADKYLFLGSELEKSCDKRFYGLLDSMKDELKSNGYDSLITDEIKKYYVSFKNSRKMDLIDRGMKYLK